MQLTSSTTPSAANYFHTLYHQRTTGSAITSTFGNPGTSAGINIIASAVRGHVVCDVFAPQQAVATEMTVHSISTDATGPFLSTGIVRHTPTTSYDGFLLNVSGTALMTGRVQVFGYRD